MLALSAIAMVAFTSCEPTDNPGGNNGGNGGKNFKRKKNNR